MKKLFFFSICAIVCCSHFICEANEEESTNDEVSANDEPRYSEEELEPLEESMQKDSGKTRPLLLF